MSATSSEVYPAALSRRTLASLVVLLSLAYVLAIAAWIAHDTLAGRAARHEVSLPIVPPRALGTNAVFFVVDGADSTGSRARFEIVVARAPVQWAAGSADRLAHGDTILPGRALGGLATAEIRDRLAAARHLFALGISGDEGADGAPTEALYLAGQRARQTALWLAAIVPGDTPIDMLNLGRQIERCAACTTAEVTWERPIAVAAVTASAPGTDLAEALAEAMASARNLPGPANCSAFALTRHR